MKSPHRQIKKKKTKHKTVIMANCMLYIFCASQVIQMVNNLPAMQETWVRSVGWEDPL